MRFQHTLKVSLVYKRRLEIIIKKLPNTKDRYGPAAELVDVEGMAARAHEE